MSSSRSIIRKHKVEAKTGYSYSTFNRLEKVGKFPQRVILGPRAVGWFEDEVDLWVKDRIRGRGPSLIQQHGGSNSSAPLAAQPAE